jgi:hypothetical protein
VCVNRYKNCACKFRGFIGTKYIRPPCSIRTLAFSPNKFTHPAPCMKRIRKVRNDGVVLTFSGITLQRNVVNISELLSDLWWMDKRPCSATWHPCLKNSPSLGYYTQGNVNESRECDRRSATRISYEYFQSCYGVGCPGVSVVIFGE